MKNLIFLILLGISTLSQAQYININPDPSGPPCWVSENSDSIFIDSDIYIEQPSFILNEESQNKELPYLIDNSKKIYFRPVFHQGAAVCQAASKIGYIFTYEINRLRDVSAEDSTNLYSHYYWANFLNWWSDDEDSLMLIEKDVKLGSISLIEKNGIPNIIDFGGVMVDPVNHWVNGYNKYYRGMHNRPIFEWELKVINEDSLVKLKHWINDHGSADSTGGLVKFGCYLDYQNTIIEELQPPSQDSGKLFIKKFGTGFPHAMTIVGYNDSIMVDYNEDGLITDTIDLNGDNIIDLRDWENGAFKVVNSWGINYWDS